MLGELGYLTRERATERASEKEEDWGGLGGGGETSLAMWEKTVGVCEAMSDRKTLTVHWEALGPTAYLQRTDGLIFFFFLFFTESDSDDNPFDSSTVPFPPEKKKKNDAYCYGHVSADALSAQLSR